MGSILSGSLLYSADELGGASAVAPEERLYHTDSSVACYGIPGDCGYWTYGSGVDGQISSFYANYHKLSGYGSQASVRKSDGSLVRSIDTSTASSSHAYAETSSSATHYYYAYYS